MAVAFQIRVATLAFVVGAVGAGVAGAATAPGIHIVNKANGISFFAPRGYVRVGGLASYILVELRDASTSTQMTIENPNGDVSIQDSKNYLKSWVGKDHLKIGQADLLHERFGAVAALHFRFTFPGSNFTEYGEELRFLSGVRSYDVVVDSWVAVAVSSTIQELLSTWGS